MNHYLINAQGDQTIQTATHGLVHCLAYSHPHWYEPKTKLAADFGRILPGDMVILCRDSKLQSGAVVEQVIVDRDDDGMPVRILIGPVTVRLGGVGVSAAARAMDKAGIAKPALVNDALSGFKQGAFCEKLLPQQATSILDWRRA